MSHSHRRHSPRPESEGSSFEPKLLPEGDMTGIGPTAVALANDWVLVAIAKRMINFMKCGCNHHKQMAREDAEWVSPASSCAALDDMVSLAGTRAKQQMVDANRRRLGK